MMKSNPAVVACTAGDKVAAQFDQSWAMYDNDQHPVWSHRLRWDTRSVTQMRLIREDQLVTQLNQALMDLGFDRLVERYQTKVHRTKNHVYLELLYCNLLTS